jgi:molecular chaperone DnaJ
VVVRVAEHELFTRDGNHLILKMPISFTQAALGAKVNAPTIDGVEAELTIKPGTQHGEVVKIPGKGLPGLRGGRRGDEGSHLRGHQSDRSANRGAPKPFHIAAAHEIKLTHG